MTSLTRPLIDQPANFIDGRWQEPRDGGYLEIRSPATGELVGRAPESSPADIDAAVAAARQSFDAGVWRETAPEERAQLMERAADLIEARTPELVDRLTSELGCPRWFSEHVHIPGPIRHLRFFAGLARDTAWIEPRTDGTNHSLVVREPVGVVGAITPWNGPLSNPMLKVGPALASGCSIVVKPSPEAPLTAFALADALFEAGLPAGVFNLVPGGRVAGERLVANTDIDKIAFTGSTAVGRSIMAVCSDRIARVTLELGGKSAAIVHDDVDIDVLVRGLLPMVLNVNGQMCIAQSRVLVARSRYAEVAEALAAAIGSAKVGDPFDPETIVGPMISERQRDRVEGYIRTGVEEGARVIAGGGRPADLDQGWYVEPTVFTDVSNSMRIAREEIFGPVIGLTPFDSDADAIAIANDSIYGLSGSVWTEDEERGVRTARQMRTGMVSINGRGQSYGTPFGGFKQSGVGREMSVESLNSYTEYKTIAVGPS